MVRESEKGYTCEECGFHYAEKEWAEKCEAWCREHHSCNIEITTHAEENPEAEQARYGAGKKP